MGNETVAPTLNSQTGFFGSLTNNLANLASAATPLATSYFDSKGAKPPTTNTATTPGAAAGTTPPPLNMTLMLAVAGGVLLLIVGWFMFKK